MRVAMFVTCLVDGIFPGVGKATVRLLERLGQRVEVPLARTTLSLKNPDAATSS
jgi:L-lactate dehydrogenase complex protein LldE